MRRKAASKLQSKTAKVGDTAEVKIVSNGEQDASVNGTENLVIVEKSAVAAVVAKYGRKRSAAENAKGNELNSKEKDVEEKTVSLPKRGKKPAKENLEGEKAKESNDIEEVTDGHEVPKEKEITAETFSGDKNEQDPSENGTESKKTEKTMVVVKRGRKKAVVVNADSDKDVPVSKRGRKPAKDNSDGEKASGSNSVKDDATNDREAEVLEEGHVLKETSENQISDSSVPKTKNISKASGKRGKKALEAKTAANEILVNDAIDDVEQEANTSNLSEDDFQSSSYSAVNKKGVKKHSKKKPTKGKKSEDINVASNDGNKKYQSTDSSAVDEIPSAKDDTKNKEPEKRGRKRKNKNDGSSTEQAVQEHKISESESDALQVVPISLKMKEVKVMLNRQDVMDKIVHENRSKSGIAEDFEEKTKTVPSQRSRGTKRGKEKTEKADTEADEQSAKVPKKTEKSKRDKIPDVTVLDFSSESKTSSGKPWNFKISSWNINGIRAWLEKDGLSYLHHEKPDILCVQETKCSDEKLPDEVKKVDGYHTYWLSGDKDGYSGVGLFTKEKPLNVEYGIGLSEHDNEGRVITVEYEKFYLVAAYVPNAGRGLVRLDYRTKWDKDFCNYLKKLDEQKPVILCGDLNVAHEEIDLANPKTNKKSAGFTKEEREGFSTLLKENDFIDSFRSLYPDTKGAYTFWTYMMNARAKDVGWRLDYFVLSKRFEESMCDSVIRKNVYGSDHCPVTLFLSV